MHPIVASRIDELAELCRRRGVKRLELFGSAARGDFDPASSDVDFLVEFGDSPRARGLSAFFALKEDLERLLSRPVDLVEDGAVRNPYVRASIDRSRQVLYAA